MIHSYNERSKRNSTYFEIIEILLIKKLKNKYVSCIK